MPCITLIWLLTLSFKAAINYYAKEGLYRHLQTVVLEYVKRYGSDPVLLFWKAYGLVMEGLMAARWFGRCILARQVLRACTALFGRYGLMCVRWLVANLLKD